MLSSVELFRDVQHLIAECVVNVPPISDGMQLWLDYCERRLPDGPWNNLRCLPYEEDFAKLTYWLQSLLEKEPPPETINGLWFGLFNPCKPSGDPSCQLYLSGSKEFPEMDWPCATDYWPIGRYSPSEVIPTLYESFGQLKENPSRLGEGVLCHGYVCLCVVQWCRGEQRHDYLAMQNQGQLQLDTTPATCT